MLNCPSLELRSAGIQSGTTLGIECHHKLKVSLCNTCLGVLSSVGSWLCPSSLSFSHPSCSSPPPHTHLAQDLSQMLAAGISADWSFSTKWSLISNRKNNVATWSPVSSRFRRAKHQERIEPIPWLQSLPESMCPEEQESCSKCSLIMTRTHEY